VQAKNERADGGGGENGVGDAPANVPLIGDTHFIRTEVAISLTSGLVSPHHLVLVISASRRGVARTAGPLTLLAAGHRVTVAL
jgi:hypothetical protein